MLFSYSAAAHKGEDNKAENGDRIGNGRGEVGIKPDGREFDTESLCKAEHKGREHAAEAFPGDKQLQLDSSLAAAALKNTVPGDFNLASDEEIMTVARP